MAVGIITRWVWNRERRRQWEAAAEVYAPDPFYDPSPGDFDLPGNYAGMQEESGASEQDGDY